MAAMLYGSISIPAVHSRVVAVLRRVSNKPSHFGSPLAAGNAFWARHCRHAVPPQQVSAARSGLSPMFAEADWKALHFLSGHAMAAERADDTTTSFERITRLDRLRQMIHWKAVADLWCSCWMWPSETNAPDAAVFSSLRDDVTKGYSALPKGTAASLLGQAKDVARNRRFFHWTLEFPEAYFDEQGRPLSNPGFDAVLGNPPWDMLRADTGEKPFFRSSGIYRHQGGGRINRYQVFLERALTLAKRGGRVGLVLPSGFATDHTAARLRRHVALRVRHHRVSTIDRLFFRFIASVRSCLHQRWGAHRRIACPLRY